MTRRVAIITRCALLLTMTGAGLSEVQAAGPINVTALPLPHPSCAADTVNAIPNDGQLDTKAFVCAINLIPSTLAAVPSYHDGGEIYIPAGIYDLDATLTVTDRPVEFRGEGQGITRLVWRQTTGPDHHGLRFVSTATTRNFTLAVRSLSLLRKDSSGGAALSASWTKPTTHDSLGSITATIHDIHIGRESPTASTAWSWDHGIQLVNATTVKIDTFNIQGPRWDIGVSAIQITGSDITGKSIGIQIRDGSITQFVRGIEVLYGAEGLHVQNVSILDTVWGINTYMTGPGTAIANNTIQSRYRGIQTYDSGAQYAISNNLIRRIGTDAWIGIEINNPLVSTRGLYARIIGNSIVSPTPPDELGAGPETNGIKLEGHAQRAMIQGNTTDNMMIGIKLASATVVDSTVMGNINRNAKVTWYVAPGATSHVAHNIP